VSIIVLSENDKIALHFMTALLRQLEDRGADGEGWVFFAADHESRFSFVVELLDHPAIEVDENRTIEQFMTIRRDYGVVHVDGWPEYLVGSVAFDKTHTT
jgi:hypothetical protein